jgi:hypothetical protein
MQQVRRLFDWFIRHEKFLIIVTIVLMIALVLQVRFSGSNISSDVTASSNQVETITPATTPDLRSSLTGIWEMSVQKKNGGVQN